MRLKKWFILLTLVVTACSQAVVANSIETEDGAVPPTPQADDAAPVTAEPAVTVEEPAAIPSDDASGTEVVKDVRD